MYIERIYSKEERHADRSTNRANQHQGAADTAGADRPGRRAAQHKSRSDFILEAACKEAENVLLDQRLFLLDEGQFAEFAAALRQGMAGNRQLETLLSRPAPWEE